MITIFNDAAGCYDRMRYNLVTVSIRRMGYPKQVALCHTRVLNNMKHFIKSRFGISIAFFQASLELNLGALYRGMGGAYVGMPIWKHYS